MAFLDSGEHINESGHHRMKHRKHTSNWQIRQFKIPIYRFKYSIYFSIFSLPFSLYLTLIFLPFRPHRNRPATVGRKKKIHDAPVGPVRHLGQIEANKVSQSILCSTIKSIFEFGPSTIDTCKYLSQYIYIYTSTIDACKYLSPFLCIYYRFMH